MNETMKTDRTVSKMTTHKLAALLALGLVVGGMVWAAAPAAPSKSDLAIALTAQKVIAQADGKEKLAAADRAFPGEVIQYDALYQNQSDRPLNNVAPTLPIPAGMIYVADTAKPPPSEASLDGQNFASIPLKRKVTLPTGEVQEQEVPASEYRALRWKVGELTPGSKTVVVARTRIVPTP